MKNYIKFGSVATIIAASSPLQAQDAEEFYCSVPELRIIISSSPGGGYDTFGRLVGQYMSEFIPCNPTFVVQNMPGGGGVRAGNYLYNSAPRDGSVIAIIDRGILTSSLLYGESSESQFEGREFLWLGSLMQETGAGTVRTDAPAQSIEEMREQPLFFGASGLETDGAMFARLLNTLLGTQLEVITGYAGQTEYMLAMAQGEIDGMLSSGSTGPNLLQSFAARDRGETRHFILFAPERIEMYGLHVPTIYEFLENDEDVQIVDLILSRLRLGRPFITTPDVPEDRLQVLRDAFARAVEHPELLADLERMGQEPSPILGEEAQELMAAIYDTPPEIVARVQAIVMVDE